MQRSQVNAQNKLQHTRVHSAKGLSQSGRTRSKDIGLQKPLDLLFLKLSQNK